jgi:drug/metabolite transporter (DMT)-like permease
VAGSYASRRARDGGAPVLLSPPRVLLAAAGLGVITGVDDFLYAWGLKSLPVSTSAILISTQLVTWCSRCCSPSYWWGSG